MKVKKFIAKNMQEAMMKVREELGSDAVILNSKPVETGGFLGLFSKKNVEIIAAFDPDLRRKNPVQKLEKKPQYKNEKTVLQKESITTEIEELKKMIIEMSKQGPTNPRSEGFPGILMEIDCKLHQQEVEESIRHSIMKTLLKRWYSEDGEEQTKETINEWAEGACGQLLDEKKYGPFLYNKRFLNVVGPTGVGKTTTIAKIAAKAVLKDSKTVAFITTDTYRIAAIDQLKTYANILNVPVEVAYTIEDFKEAKEKFQAYDLVLVDSAGRNFQNQSYVKQLGEVIDFNDEMETHLVLSLTSKYSDMKKIIEQFTLLNIDKFIFTKADETTTYGAMLNTFTEFKIGSSYLTMGQNVPDDIIESSPNKVIERLMRS